MNVSTNMLLSNLKSCHAENLKRYILNTYGKIII